MEMDIYIYIYILRCVCQRIDVFLTVLVRAYGVQVNGTGMGWLTACKPRLASQVYTPPILCHYEIQSSYKRQWKQRTPTHKINTCSLVSGITSTKGKGYKTEDNTTSERMKVGEEIEVQPTNTGIDQVVSFLVRTESRAHDQMTLKLNHFIRTCTDWRNLISQTSHSNE